uniref:Uncharacterized protein n=1 Tax=Romanomermis culicivorax TaxID=13658 RepID=A0A915IMF4_ROMCU
MNSSVSNKLEHSSNDLKPQYPQCCWRQNHHIGGQSVGILGSSPWAAKRSGGTGVPSIGRYDETTMMSPVVFGVDGFMLTSVASFGSGGKAGDVIGAETTVTAKYPILITQTG